MYAAWLTALLGLVFEGRVNQTCAVGVELTRLHSEYARSSTRKVPSCMRFYCSCPQSTQGGKGGGG